MKHLKSFKIFEAESDEYRFNSDDYDGYQRKNAIAAAKKMMKVAKPYDGKRIDLKPYNPVEYTDVPLDVYLKRKEKGVEDVPKKADKEDKITIDDLKRKEKGVEDVPKKADKVDKITIDDLNNLKKAISNSEGMSDFKKNYPDLMKLYYKNRSIISKDLFDELNKKDLEKKNLTMLSDLKNAISNSEGMSDFKKNYPDLMSWYNSNKSIINKDLFDELNKKDLEKKNLTMLNDLRKAISYSRSIDEFIYKYPELMKWYYKNRSIISENEFDKIDKYGQLRSYINQMYQVEREKERRKGLTPEMKEKEKLEREKEKLELQEISRINKIGNDFTKICTKLIRDFIYYENFKLIYPKEVAWIKENNFLEKFLFYFDYKEGVYGLEVVEFSNDLSSRLNELGFKVQSDMSMSKNFNGEKVDIFNLRFKDINKNIFLAVVDGNVLPLTYTHTKLDTSVEDLSSTIDILADRLR